MFKSLKLKSLFLFVTVLGSVASFAQENEVSDAELNKFADAYINMQMQNQEAQQEMIAIIQNEGLKVERFSEIDQATMDPNKESDATPAELKMHANATDKMKKMQPALEKKAIEGIESKGLTFERFQELATVIQQDQSLQQRLQDILMKSQGQ
ncbi:DUF4168 domain-containing protein [Aequorivita viscosa]|uniref:DUF4168 domain-containing protein n=1 Tax=Aequorivita viscosa TaxID=797419 RepID=A0A1M6N7B1_9FLAO|nr:DUF4168 domain-containing protein [Aequorivita viscosa]SDX44619.1 protein of unknown function [Aequorivita viscosa]SHJ91620.1 protein of unknown function [Aequorivita viscosa]